MIELVAVEAAQQTGFVGEMFGPRKNRNKVEIAAQVLKVAADGAKKTHIMYGANLSFDQLEKYLKLLLDKGLLDGRSTERGTYALTDRGRRYLQEFVQYQSSREVFHEKTRVLRGYLELERLAEPVEYMA